MSQLDDFLATVEHRTPDHILYYFGCTPDLQQRLAEHAGTKDLASHYELFAPVSVGLKRPENSPPIDYSPYWQNEELPEGTTINGVGVAMVPSGFYHFFGYVSPLRKATSLSEIENYPLEDMKNWDGSHLPCVVQNAHAEGRVVQAWVGHMYETAWQIRGYEQFLMDTIERPEWAECMLQKLADQNMVKAITAAEAGVDMLHCGDDVANQKALMFSPDHWREVHHSRWKNIWRAVKDVNPNCKIWYHSDGNITDILDDLVDSGLDIINPLQPECLDVDAIHRRYGKHLTFDGTIGTQTTLPFGKPHEVTERVKYVIENYGRNGGLIVSPTHVLEPEVPLANIDAMCAACREFGTFA